VTKGAYSSIVDISERDSYLIPNADPRGIGAPYVQKGSFFDASRPFDPTTLAGSGIQLAAIPSPISNKWIHLPDGTVSSPGLAFAGETNSGRYRIGSNNIGESINSTLVFDWNATRLRLESSYSLFLGATASFVTPGDDIVAIQDTNTSGLRWSIQNLSTGTAAHTVCTLVNNASDARYVSFGVVSSNWSVIGDYRSAGEGFFEMASAGLAGTARPLSIWNRLNSYLRFGTTDLERMRILAGGQVCINANSCG
jgi:hypothetical protein